MEAQKVPASCQWIPAHEIHHAYDATSPVFTPSQPHTDDNYDPCPKFTFHYKYICTSVIYDNNIELFNSDLETIALNHDSDIIEIITITCMRISEVPTISIQHSSVIIKIDGAENSIKDTSTFQVNSINMDTPLKGAWDLMLITPEWSPIVLD